MKKFLIRVVGIVLVVSAVVGYKTYQKNQLSLEVKEIAYSSIQKTPEYLKHKELIDKMFDSAHRHAFDSAYAYKKRGSGTFDMQRYMSTLENVIAAPIMRRENHMNKLQEGRKKREAAATQRRADNTNGNFGRAY